ncbi:AAA family ATPase [Vibrio sp. 10N.222.54.F12]|uniref:AAA family ATPase n=1 Tax=Vibrio TaxID=662 RepID=UPI000C85ADEC|nr:AAA family ATPase [Vibrio tasmaniensis]PML11194.1 AAA family ATPase [Vibrio tasmaniensis]
MKKQKLTLVRGIPGSGKTTMASKLDAHLVEADMFFVDKDGNYNYCSQYIKDAHAWCQLEMKRLLRSGHDVVVANTFIRCWEVQGYIEAAQSLNLELDVEVIEAEGKYQNIHGVPDRTVERMKNQYESFALNPDQSSQIITSL